MLACPMDRILPGVPLSDEVLVVCDGLRGARRFRAGRSLDHTRCGHRMFDDLEGLIESIIGLS